MGARPPGGAMKLSTLARRISSAHVAVREMTVSRDLRLPFAGEFGDGLYRVGRILHLIGDALDDAYGLAYQLGPNPDFCANARKTSEIEELLASAMLKAHQLPEAIESLSELGVQVTVNGAPLLNLARDLARSQWVLRDLRMARSLVVSRAAPPRFVESGLAWLATPEWSEEVVGSALEQYERKLDNHSRRYTVLIAQFLYSWNACRSIPGLVRMRIGNLSKKSPSAPFRASGVGRETNLR